MRNDRHEEGSVTIEATISLSTFMFAIVTILTIVNICLVQARISYALNATAKELSQYSYLYSLTGIPTAEGKLASKAKAQTQDVDKVLNDVNDIFTEVENLAGTDVAGVTDPAGIADKWNEAAGSVERIEASGSSLKDTIEDIAKDPKGLIFGIAKMAGSRGLDLAKSRLIAAPLAKVMVKKHLVNEKGGDVEAFLKQKGVVPSASGEYMDGLDFSQSTLFPEGSNEIRINVKYDVKVITLLNLKVKFHFNQSAVTHGWLAGESSYRSSSEFIQNNNVWTESTLHERSELIRHQGIADLKDEGYQQTQGLTDVQLYNPDTNEFVMISSMNPLYSAKGEDSLTLDDLDDDALREAIERLCGKMDSTTNGLDSVTTKQKGSDGSTTRETYDCSGASNKIVLVIPEDPGLKEKIEEIIASSNTRGVEIEIQTGYGNGARTTEVETEAAGGNQE